MAKASLMLFAMVVAALMLAQPASAAALTSVVEDPVGDAGSPGITAQAYQDIVKAAVTLKDGRFVLTMKLAGSIPASPPLPPQIVLLEWSWRLDTDPTAFPAGFPYAPGDKAPADFMVFILWDGTSFTATLIDRSEARLTPVPFLIKGSVITASVDAALLGNPSNFGWFAPTEVWPTQLGTQSSSSYEWLDRAPDFGWAPWPA